MTTRQQQARFFNVFHPAPHRVWAAWGLAIKALSFVIALALLIVSAKIQVPFWPVPVTMQSAVVLLLPCVLGTRMGLATIMAYLGLGAAGYPVFADVAMQPLGPAYFLGPTGGYLLGFVVSAALLGSAYENWPVARRPLPLFGLMIVAQAVIMTFGAAWLAFGVPALGLEKAIAAGVMPFLFGAVAKSALSVMCVRAINKNRAL